MANANFKGALELACKWWEASDTPNANFKHWSSLVPVVCPSCVEMASFGWLNYCRIKETD